MTIDVCNNNNNEQHTNEKHDEEKIKEKKFKIIIKNWNRKVVRRLEFLKFCFIILH